MATKIKKLHCLLDQPPGHHKAIFKWKNEVPSALLFNEVWKAIRPAERLKTESYDFPLFDRKNLARIVEEVGYHERLLIFLRPRYKLDRLTVEPEDIIIDVHIHENQGLLYSFYNPTKRENICITAKLEEDITGVYRKISTHPDDLQLRQYFIKQAMEEYSVNLELGRRVPELMTVEQLAKYLQLEEKTIRNWVAGKAVPFKKVGGAVRFSKVEIEQALHEGELGKKVERRQFKPKR